MNELTKKDISEIKRHAKAVIEIVQDHFENSKYVYNSWCFGNLEIHLEKLENLINFITIDQDKALHKLYVKALYFASRSLVLSSRIRDYQGFDNPFKVARKYLNLSYNIHNKNNFTENYMSRNHWEDFNESSNNYEDSDEEVPFFNWLK